VYNKYNTGMYISIFCEQNINACRETYHAQGLCSIKEKEKLRKKHEREK